MTPQGQTGGPAQQPGWFSRNWKWVAALGCLLPMTCCGIFGAATYFGVRKVIEGTPVFAEAIEKANANAEVTGALGSPVTPGFMLQGSVKQSGNTGTADFTIPLEGPKGKGSLEVSATLHGSAWTFQTLNADVGGKTVDLLAGEGVQPKLPGGGAPAVDDDDAPPPDPDDEPLPDDPPGD